MNSKTYEFLNLLLWSADRLCHPTLRNLTDSYESWAYRNGLLRQVSRLEQQEFIERAGVSADDRLFRLTARGRLCALGGRDPMERWARAWDGKWRMVLFDIPNTHNLRRVRLRRFLRDRGFGYLQRSAWITPDPLAEEREVMEGGRVNVESLVLLEARPCAGESDADIVKAAWNFELIDHHYQRHLQLLDQRPTGPVRTEGAATALLRWGASELEAWLEAVTRDPLLPARLLPPGYLGQRAWRRRLEVIGDASRQMRTFARK